MYYAKSPILRFFMLVIAISLVERLLPGIISTSIFSTVLFALILSFFNFWLRPILILLTIPLSIFTFGIFLLILNGLIIYLVDFLVPGFYILDFGSAVLGAILISIISGLLNFIFIGDEV